MVLPAMFVETYTLNTLHSVTVCSDMDGTGEAFFWYTFLPKDGQAEALAALLPRPYVLSVIHSRCDWDGIFSPWPAPRLNAKRPDFGGGAAAYYRRLCNEWVPALEARLPVRPAARGLLGYSLAGLFALYGTLLSPFFPYVASVSGSLWFDGWTDFLDRSTPDKLPRAVYLSLGDGEARTRHPRLATVQTATEHTYAFWQRCGVPAVLESNPGGHFQDIAGRLAKAAGYLARQANAHRRAV